MRDVRRQGAPYTRNMNGVKQADAIDTRMVFRVYAWIAGGTGFMLFGWGPMWLGMHMPGQPFGKAALIRVAGAILMAAGCCGAAPATVGDPMSRRKALAWFGAGHAVLGLAMLTQSIAIWGPGLPEWLVALTMGVAWLFFYFWWTAEGEVISPRSPLISLFSGRGTTSTERLRSTYEEQIRQAAGQEERNRLARELHDSVKQQVFAIQTSAATAEVRFDTDPDGARQALAEVRAAAREAMTEMEVMLDQLHAAPLENVGLIEALKKQSEALGFRTGAQVDFSFEELPPSEDLTPGVHQAIFRVAQEALANVAKHARASNVKVYLFSSGGWVRLVTEDDGTGFQPEKARRGMGIANMRARAEECGGFLDLETTPGGGTTIRFSVPYRSQSAREHRQRALTYAAVMAVCCALAWWQESKLQAVVAVVSGISACRQAVAWRRVRKRSGRDDHRAG